MEERFDRLDRFRDQRDRRLDQFLETGRQLVDGVSGRRPGQRPGGRRSGLDLDSVGRWVGEKVEWLLEEDDDWQEPWQEAGRGRPEPARSTRSARRPLEAISRRSRRGAAAQAPAPPSTPPVAQEFNAADPGRVAGGRQLPGAALVALCPAGSPSRARSRAQSRGLPPGLAALQPPPDRLTPRVQ